MGETCSLSRFVYLGPPGGTIATKLQFALHTDTVIQSLLVNSAFWPEFDPRVSSLKFLLLTASAAKVSAALRCGRPASSDTRIVLSPVSLTSCNLRYIDLITADSAAAAAAVLWASPASVDCLSYHSGRTHSTSSLDIVSALRDDANHEGRASRQEMMRYKPTARGYRQFSRGVAEGRRRGLLSPSRRRPFVAVRRLIRSTCRHQCLPAADP